MYRHLSTWRTLEHLDCWCIYLLLQMVEEDYQSLHFTLEYPSDRGERNVISRK